MKETLLQHKYFAFLIFVMSLLYLLKPLIDAKQSVVNKFLMQSYASKVDSSRVHIVYFDQEDISELGGWPLPRNIYGFLADRLYSLGVKTVGFDIFWHENFAINDENNQFLAHILDSHNVVGSFYFVNSSNSNPGLPRNSWPCPKDKNVLLAKGINPPDQMLLGTRAQFGFVNLYAEKNGMIDNAYLLMRYSDYCYPSFANLLASQAAGVGFDSLKSEIIINYTFDFNNMPLIPAREVIHASIDDSISLKLKDAIVLVGIIAPQFGFVKQTPVDPTMPVIAVHAQIVENLVSGTFLRPVPGWFYFLFLSLLSFLLFLYRAKPVIQIVICTSAALLCLLITILVWRYLFIFPLYVHLAALSFCAVFSFAQIFVKNKEKYFHEVHSRVQLEKELYAKVRSAAKVEQEYGELREKYQREIKELRDGLAVLPKKYPEHLMRKYASIIFSPKSPMMDVIAEIEGIGGTDEPALITGESGTGKELVARAIHRNSKRAGKPFVAINCSSIAESLLESELFGYKKGAFTGAGNDKPGFFEAAHLGTIFLDEISETSTSFQASLLRILQEKTFYRVGATTPTHVDVRIIAATNKNLVSLVDSGRFRSDLYYRLNVLPIELPPLRRRLDDIQPLVNYFLDKQHIELSVGALNALKNYHWPGNVRELENICTRMKIFEHGTLVRAEWIEKQTGVDTHRSKTESIQEKILASYRELEFCNDANTKIAQKLGHLHRSTITEYLKGMTFQFFSEERFHLDRAVNRFNSSHPHLDSKVRNKMLKYLKNLAGLLDKDKSITENADTLKIHFRKLPGMYQDAALDCALAYIRGLWDLS